MLNNQSCPITVQKQKFYVERASRESAARWRKARDKISKILKKSERATFARESEVRSWKIRVPFTRQATMRNFLVLAASGMANTQKIAKGIKSNRKNNVPLTLRIKNEYYELFDIYGDDYR